MSPPRVQVPSLRSFLGSIACRLATATRGGLPMLEGGLTQTDIDVRDVVNATVTASGQSQVNVKTAAFVALGDGVHDDTAAINAACAACAASGSSTVFLPPGSYKISGTIVVPAGVTIRGSGAASTTIVTSQQITAISLGSGCSLVALAIQGPASGTYAAGIGVSCVGTFNGVGIAPTRTIAPILRDCAITNFGLYGVFVAYSSGGSITGCTITGHGYAGIGGASCDDMIVSGNVVSTIGPGDGIAGDAYGIFIDRKNGVGAVTDVIVSDPVSHRCTISNNTVISVIAVGGGTNGQGIDTHAGRDFSIVGNRINGCQVGIGVVASSITTGGVGAFQLSAKRVSIVGNTLGGTAGVDGYGILVSGAKANNASASDLYAEGIVISGNTTLNHGAANDLDNGAIFFHATKGTICTGNTVRNAQSVGINVHYENYGINVTGNTIVDPHDATLAVPVCIGVGHGGDNITGIIGFNAFKYDNAALDTHVAVEAIRVNGGPRAGLNLEIGRHTFDGIDATHLAYTEATSTGVNASGLYEERGSAVIALVSGATGQFVDVAFAKRFPQVPTSITFSESSAAFAPGGKAATYNISAVTASGFRITAKPTDLANWSASANATLMWRATT